MCEPHCVRDRVPSQHSLAYSAGATTECTFCIVPYTRGSEEQPAGSLIIVVGRGESDIAKGRAPVRSRSWASPSTGISDGGSRLREPPARGRSGGSGG